MSINMVVIQGAVSAPPESQTVKGASRVFFKVRTTESWLDKNAGSVVERSDTHNCAAKGPVADLALSSLGEGSEVFIQGKLHTRRWFDKKTDAPRQATEIWVLRLHLMSGSGAADDVPLSINAVENEPDPAPAAS